MGRTGKWIKSFLIGGGKKDHKEKKIHGNHTIENPTTSPIIVIPPKEKRRWSFRRSSASSTAAGTKDSNHKSDNNNNNNTTSKPAAGTTSTAPAQALQSDLQESENVQTKHALDIASAAAGTTAVAEADTAIILHSANNDATPEQEASAAIKIQSVYRSYLARKALRALRGLVKLQALARGHLVRKQATATLRCMQALVTVQARARAQRIRAAAEEAKTFNYHWQLSPRLITNQDSNFGRQIFDLDTDQRAMEDENIKIVEMDHGEPKEMHNRTYYSNHNCNDQSPSQSAFSKQDYYQQLPPLPSLPITDMSPRTCSGHFEDYSFPTAQSSPHYYYSPISKPPSTSPFTYDYADSISYDSYPLSYPSYMANTESSRAKARSQSAPKQRPADPFERQPSIRRKSSADNGGRSNIPRAVRMQRSSSHVGSTAQNYQYPPWSMIKLNKSMVSLKDGSECGSNCSVRTNGNYCRSLVAFDHTHGPRY